jgi:hypothetical protein
MLTDTSMWKLGLGPRNSQKRNTQMGFSLQCVQLWWRGIVSANRGKYSLIPDRLDQPRKETLSNVLSECLFASVSKSGTPHWTGQKDKQTQT